MFRKFTLHTGGFITMSSLKRAITAKDLTRIEVLSDPQFTPDGKAYTYISTTINKQDEYESHIFSQNLSENHKKKWTFGHDKNRDRKSTRLNSSHVAISYAVFCLKKKKRHIKKHKNI